MMKADQFIDHVPSQVLELIKFFTKRGLELTVVGGIPRDYLLTGKIGCDWDIEVSSHVHGFSVSFWKDLSKELRQWGEVSHLAYQVIRLKMDEYEFEFSPPRVEVFNDNDHHKNFDAEYDFKLPPCECWKRRDFTVNAIGFKLKEKSIEVIDPFSGQEMLFQKILHPCSEQFVRDPVRYLRAYRFSLRLAFDFSDTLKNYLQTMPQGFSAHYLYQEMKKSKNPLKYYVRLMNDGCQRLPLVDKGLTLESFKKALVEPFNLYSWLMALEYQGLKSEAFCDYFGLSRPLLKKLVSFAQHSRDLSHLNLDLLKEDFETVCESRELHLVFSWYYAALQLCSKGETVFIKEFIQDILPEWSYLLSFEPLKDVKHIEPALRSKYVVWNLCQRI